MIRKFSLLFSVMFFVTFSPDSTPSKYTEKHTNIPSKYIEIYNFLELLKWNSEKSKTPNWDINKISGYLSDGVQFIDTTNKTLSKNIIKTKIISELKGCEGVSYEMLSHLGSIYAEPYKQYSELTFEDNKGQSIVYVSDWYKLVFVNIKNKYLLKSVEYTMAEGD